MLSCLEALPAGLTLIRCHIDVALDRFYFLIWAASCPFCGHSSCTLFGQLPGGCVHTGRERVLFLQLLDRGVFVLSCVILDHFLESLVPSYQGVYELAGTPVQRSSVVHCLGEALTVISFERLDEFDECPSLLPLRQESVDGLNI